MSYNLLPLNPQQIFSTLPSYNRIHNTLLMIETVKNISNYSLADLDEVMKSDQHIHEQDSLGIQIQSAMKNSLPTEETLKNEKSSKGKKKGCTCKKTKCLKMYCECFALGKMCTTQCECYSCCNNDEHVQSIKKAKQGIKTKNSRKNTQGCTCKKSQCQKKYCECFNAGVPCSQACKCCDCQNHQHQFCSVSGTLDLANPQIDKKGNGLSKLSIEIFGNQSDEHIEQNFKEERVISQQKGKSKEMFDQQKNKEANLNSFKSFASLDLCAFLA